jgi:DNA-binding transcriptional regulator LsrR (DeoR family)
MMKNIQTKQMAVAFGHLLEAGIKQTARVSMLAYVGAKNGVTAKEIAKVFGVTRATAYGAMADMATKNLVRCEVTLHVDGSHKTHVGKWFINPYGKDVIANFMTLIRK